MPTPKYIFTANDDQLTVTLDNSSFQWENDDTSSYREASVNLYDLKKINLFDFGKFQREFIFENIKTIGGVIPDNIDEAYDLISNLIPVASGGGTTVDTAFITQTYLATMSVAHNPEQPNFNIYLTGNLDLTITGTVNGDAGIINLYFSGTEIATLNGFEDLVINGNGAMIPVWFIHDSEGLKWYLSVAQQETSNNSGISNINKWLTKLRVKTPNLKLAFVGDSTSDLEGNAVGLLDIDNYTKAGFPLEGFDTDNMPNFGSNGQTITGFINDGGAKGLEALLNADLDLIIFSYGINDIRQNMLTKEQLKTNIITCIDYIREAMPNCDIILRMPNSFDIPTTDTYIKQGSYGSLAEAAQAQSDILYNAYLELENKWNNVVLFNSQDLIFGRVSKPTVTPLMSDEIHPVYSYMLNVLVNDFIGYLIPFRKEQAVATLETNYNSPWEDYNRVFEKEPEFIKIGEGTLDTYGPGYVFIETDKNEAYKIVSKFSPLDYISFSKGVLIEQAYSISVGHASRINYYGDLPENLLEIGSKVEFYKSRYNNTQVNQRYQNDTLNYPYRHKVMLGNCEEDIIRIGSFQDDDIVTKRVIGAKPSNIVSLSDAVIVLLNLDDELDLSTATFQVIGEQIQIDDISGDFSQYSDTIAFIYSSTNILP